MIVKVDSSIIPYDPLIRALCGIPYYSHAKGCPNFDKKEGCPPLPLITEVLDFEKELYVIYTTFNVGEFAEIMRIRHPEWKEARYPDHQKASRKRVQAITEKLKLKHPDWPVEYFPQQTEESWTSCRQWYNPRRWQGTARKEHKQELERFLAEHEGLIINKFPEAHGINLTGLMHEIGIKLGWQWPPIHNLDNKSYIISTGGHSKTE